MKTTSSTIRITAIGNAKGDEARFDAHELVQPNVERYRQSVQHQRGSLVLINAQPVGLDLISRKGAYAAAHPKLIRSYAIDALAGSEDGFDAPPLELASAFLDEIRVCEERIFPCYPSCVPPQIGLY